MPNFIYIGSVVVNIYNNVTRTPNPPGVDEPYNEVFNYDLHPITWADPKPPLEIQSLTPSDLVNNLEGFREITFSPVFEYLSGLQQFDFASVPTNSLSFRGEDPIVQTPTQGEETGIGNYGNINVSTFGNPPRPLSDIPLNDIGDDQQLSLFIWNAGGGCIGLCQQYSITGLTLNAVLNIRLVIPCDEINLETSFCTSICKPTAGNFKNANACLDDYLSFCFSEGLTGDAIIWNNNSCQTYFEDYIQEINPTSEIDEKLTEFCSVKVPGVDDFNSLTNINQKNLCGCHLDPKIYENIRKDLQNEFPGSILAGEIAQCLFPGCTDSPFKAVVTGKTCPVPKCINIASINNNGTIKGGGDIIQDDKDCEDLAGKGSGNKPPDEEIKTWIEKYWLWLVIGISLLVVLIIIILIIVASESNKKKPGNPKILKKE
jgi:hypothetical protein